VVGDVTGDGFAEIAIFEQGTACTFAMRCRPQTTIRLLLLEGGSAGLSSAKPFYDR
jgi:hypothetical protein